MSPRGGLRQFRALISFFLALVVFLGIGATLTVIQLRGTMREIARANALRDLDLLGSLTREALIRRDYITIEEYLSAWGSDHPAVAKVSAVAPNGHVIASYEGKSGSEHMVRVSKVIREGGRILALLTLEENLQVIEHQVARAIRNNIIALFLFALTMAAVLWITLQRTAVIPAERLAEEVRRLNLTLEERVRDRTAALVASNEELEREIGERLRAEAVLRTAKDELERQNLELRTLDKMKDALLRDVSHELKTPVAKHAMQMEILTALRESPALSAKEKEAFEVMDESIARQGSVIRNLLDLARLESGGRSYSRDSLRLDELVGNVVEDHRFSIEHAEITVSADVPAVTISSDYEMLWHVFSNIIGNSIKFRRRDEPGRIDISGVVREGKVLLRFRDNGAGMSPEVQKRVFSRFFQATPSVEGSGVGLTICRRIVSDLGGDIRISSPGIGQGTVVEVELPAS